MTRPPGTPARNEFLGPDVATFDAVVARSERPGVAPAGELQVIPYIGILLNSPPFADALTTLMGLGRGAGDNGSFSPLAREVVQITLAAAFDEPTFIVAHAPRAIAAGVEPSEIIALRDGEDDALSEQVRLAAGFARAVVDGAMTNKLWDAMEALVGLRGAIELAALVVSVQSTQRLYRAFGLAKASEAEVQRAIGGPDAIETRERGEA